MALGSLVVRLGLDAAEFTAGLTRSEQQAKRFADSVGNKLAAAGRLGAIGVAAIGTAAVGAFVAVDRLAKQAGDFQDLAEKTGATAEDFASLAVAAGTAGAEIGSIGAASVKLTANLSKLQDEGKGAGAALAALNLPIKDFKQLDPVAQLEAVAKKLAEYRDGAGKTAVAVALFGKAGAELLPFLKELGSGVGRQNLLTKEQIALADEYADRQARTNATLNVYAQQLAAQTLPAVIAFQSALSDTIKPLIAVDEKATKLGQNTAVTNFAISAVERFADIIEAGGQLASFFDFLGTSIGGKFAAIDADLRGDVAGARQIRKDLEKDLTDIAGGKGSTLRQFAQNLRDRAAAARQGGIASPAGPTKTLNFSDNAGAAAKAGAEAKRILDGQIKEIRAFADRQQAALDFINASSQASYDAGLISLQQFFTEQRGIRDAALQADLAALDKEIAVLQSARSKAGKPEDQISIDNKIAEARDKKTKASEQAAFAAERAIIQERQQVSALAAQYDDLRATILDLQGDSVAAAQSRINQQVAAAGRIVAQSGGNPADVTALRDQLTIRAELNGLNERAALIAQVQATAEGRAQLALVTGREGEIANLVRTGEIRQQSIAQLAVLADQYDRLAAASGNPKLIADAEAFRLKLDELRVGADALGMKFTSIFEGSFANAFGDFINGTKTASQAFKAFGNTVAAEINKMIAAEASKALFGQGGAAGGAGGFFASLFGGASAGGASGGSFFSSIGSFFTGLGFANGGRPPVGRASLVGEGGPELFVPDTAGRIISNAGLRSMGAANGSNYNISINVPQTTSFVTGTQLAADLQRKLAQGGRNN